MYNLEKQIIKSVEGIFTGKFFSGDDGKEYQVPANYASKSELVEGDRMRLIISDDGDIFYKQLERIDRKNLIGILEEKDEKFYVDVNGIRYEVLVNSVSYMHGKDGDKAVISVPVDKPSEYAALRAIV